MRTERTKEGAHAPLVFLAPAYGGVSCQVNAADFPAAPLQTVPGPHRSATKGSVVAAAGSRPGSRFVRSATKRPCPLPGTAAHGSAQASRRLRCACRRTDTRAQLMWLASVNVPRRHVVAPRRRSRAPCQPHVPNQDPHGTTRPSTTRPNLPNHHPSENEVSNCLPLAPWQAPDLWAAPPLPVVPPPPEQYSKREKSRSSLPRAPRPRPSPHRTHPRVQTSQSRRRPHGSAPPHRTKRERGGAELSGRLRAPTNHHLNLPTRLGRTAAGGPSRSS